MQSIYIYQNLQFITQDLIYYIDEIILLTQEFIEIESKV